MSNYFKNCDSFIIEFTERLKTKYLKSLSKSSPRERYNCLSQMIMEYMSDDWIKTNEHKQKTCDREVYYFSMEFLLGRLTNFNLESLGIKNVVIDSFSKMGISLDDCLNIEKDPGLGNGGLGRLAACYIDSASTLKIPFTGNTIRYKYGLFKQKIKNGYQEERPDNWLSDSFNYEYRNEEEQVEIPFYGYVDNESGRRTYHPEEYIKAVPYDVPIPGYKNGMVNTLRLWNAEPGKKYPLNRSALDYEKDLREICGFLYPNDSSYEGKKLRLVQQYFFSAAGLKSITNKELKKYGTLKDLDKHVVIHLNDTHPSIIIGELMRVLLDEELMEWDEAYRITTNTICYTNHSLLREVMETWSCDLVREIVPRVMEIFDEINRRFVDGLYSEGYKKEYVDKVAIIKDNNIYMANLSSAVSFKINGVAKLHSNLMMEHEFKEFNELFKGKFTNVTNGVSPRRWLIYSNPELSSLLDSYCNGFKDDLTKLEMLPYDESLTELITTFGRIKNKRKEILANFVNKDSKKKHPLDPSFIFDVQVKRLHEYKRQLLNALHIIYLMKRIEKDEEFRNNFNKHAFIFGAKAASSYAFAKKVIKLINTISEKIDNSELLSKYLNVTFIENYGVTESELINPAVEISEQISLASYEASGTGNMKAMMNGSITIGTMDGANVEMHELLGDDYIKVFGLTKDDVKKIQPIYDPTLIYNSNKTIKEVVDSLIDGYFDNVSNDEFKDIYDTLTKYDTYMVLKDFESYRIAHAELNELYKDKNRFYSICLKNIKKSYYFSSDRSINDYKELIWHVEKLK